MYKSTKVWRFTAFSQDAPEDADFADYSEKDLLLKHIEDHLDEGHIIVITQLTEPITRIGRKTTMHSPRWPKCDWCANYPECEEGTCECCRERCDCPTCIGPINEDVFPKSQYPDAWLEKKLRDEFYDTREIKGKQP